jgi:hypothetical protein
MENNDFDPLNNPLVNDEVIEEINMGKDPLVEQFVKHFPINDNYNGTISYVEKISVLKNGEWSYDTYIKSNNDITEEVVIEYINKLEKGEYEVEDISYEFYGGPPVGRQMYFPSEIEGDNVWVVNLKVNLYSYLKKKGHIGDFEDLYTQTGGIRDELKKIINEDYLPKESRSINSIIVDTINKLFFIEDNIDIKDNKKQKFSFNSLENVKQVHTNFDGEQYYTFLNVFKDGRFLEKRRINSLRNPISWQVILGEIMNLNKNSNYYGYVYKLSTSWNKGYILETTNDARYKINYNCK